MLLETGPSYTESAMPHSDDRLTAAASDKGDPWYRPATPGRQRLLPSHQTHGHSNGNGTDDGQRSTFNRAYAPPVKHRHSYEPQYQYQYSHHGRWAPWTYPDPPPTSGYNVQHSTASTPAPPRYYIQPPPPIIKSTSYQHEPPPPPVVYIPPTKGRKEDESYIYEVRDADVLCGRGAPTSWHPGNQYFRRLVEKYQHKYLAAKRIDKPEIATRIVELVEERGGRFLKRTKVVGVGTRGHFCWSAIGEQRAYEKACQALREGAPEIRRQLAAKELAAIRKEVDDRNDRSHSGKVSDGKEVRN